MKIALIVLGAIIALLLVLLFLPLSIDLTFAKELRFKIKYFGIIIFDSEKNVKLK